MSVITTTKHSLVQEMVALRCQLCPRTSYQTAGFAASVLLTHGIAQPASSSTSIQLSPSLQQEIVNPLLATKEFESIVEKGSSQQLKADVLGHVILTYLVDNDLQVSSIYLQDYLQRDILPLLGQNKTKLIFFLTKDVSLTSALSELSAKNSKIDVKTSHDHLWHMVAFFSKSTKRHYSLMHERDAMIDAMYPLIGFNAQPSVQSRCQFRYLWQLLPIQSAIRARSPEELLQIQQTKVRTLHRLANKTLVDGSQLSIEDWDRLITNVLEDNGDDWDVYNLIRQKASGTTILEAIAAANQSSVNTKVTSSMNDDGGEGRSNNMANWVVENIPQPVRSLLDVNPSSTVLDYGCAEGGITSSLAQALNLPSTRMIGADVRAISAPGFQFVQLPAEDLSKNESPALGKILPSIPDGSIALINASMVFHHVTFVEAAVAELRRVIDKRGVVVIREHDCDSVATSVFLDIVHGLYSLAWSTPIEWPDFIEEYSAFYRSREDWNKVMASCGFELITGRAQTQQMKKHYDAAKRSTLYNNRIPNMTRAYYAVYQPTLPLVNFHRQPTSTLASIERWNRFMKEAAVDGPQYEPRPIKRKMEEPSASHSKAAPMGAVEEDPEGSTTPDCPPPPPPPSGASFIQAPPMAAPVVAIVPPPSMHPDSSKATPAPAVTNTSKVIFPTASAVKVIDDDFTVLQSKSIPGKMYKFYRKTGVTEWL